MGAPPCRVNCLGPEPSRNSLPGSYRPKGPGPGADGRGPAGRGDLCEAAQVSSFSPVPDRDVRQGKRGRSKLRSDILFLSGAEKGDIPAQRDSGDFCFGLGLLPGQPAAHTVPSLRELGGRVRDLRPEPHASCGLVSTRRNLGQRAVITLMAAACLPVCACAPLCSAGHGRDLLHCALRARDETCVQMSHTLPSLKFRKVGIAVPVLWRKRLRFRGTAQLPGPGVQGQAWLAARSVFVPRPFRGLEWGSGYQTHPVSGVHVGSG